MEVFIRITIICYQGGYNVAAVSSVLVHQRLEWETVENKSEIFRNPLN